MSRGRRTLIHAATYLPTTFNQPTRGVPGATGRPPGNAPERTRNAYINVDPDQPLTLGEELLEAIKSGAWPPPPTIHLRTDTDLLPCCGRPLNAVPVTDLMTATPASLTCPGKAPPMTTLPTVLLPPPPADGDPNIAALRIVLAHITAHPDEWDQSAWRCESGMCLFGTAAVLAGGTFPYDVHDGRWVERFGSYASNLVDTPTNDRMTIEKFAQEVFALTDYDADSFANPNNTLTHLAVMIDDLANGRPVIGRTDTSCDEYDDPDEGSGSI